MAEVAVRLLIVDDDPLVRAGLTMMLDGVHGIVVVAEAADGDEVSAAVDRHFPDVVLMDIRMPRVDGIAATERLTSRRRPPAVIVLTTFDSDENVLRALRVGAIGFLLKDTPPDRIADAVRRVAAGEPMLGPSILRRLMQQAVTRSRDHESARSALRRLSPREHQVLAAIGRGQSNAEIADELTMTIATVKAHVTHILTKLDLTNRTQLAILAHDAGLA